MGTNKRLRLRLGVKRLRPNAWKVVVVQADVEQRVGGKGARLQQAAKQLKLAESSESRQSRLRAKENLEFGEFLERSRSCISNKLARCITKELKIFPTTDCKQNVIEKVLNHNTIRPILLDYYPRPCKAKSIYDFLESYRAAL